MKYALIIVATISLLISTTSHIFADDPPRDGVFIHITHGADDPHRLLMAMNLASMMAEDHDVLVYYDIEGVTAVLKDSPDISFAHFPTSKELIQTLLEKNVILMACPGCLEVAGKAKDDLKEGIEIADKEMFFKFTNGRILTLDY